MDWRFQLTENAVKRIVLAWHRRCTWNFLHKLIQSTIAILVQRSRICPLDRLLSRTDWEVCLTAIADESETPPSKSSLRGTQPFIESLGQRTIPKYELKDTIPTARAKRTSPPMPNPLLKQTLYSL